MARYEHLSIYQQAMDVALHFEKVVAGFSRYHKYTLGTELRNQSRAEVYHLAPVPLYRRAHSPGRVAFGYGVYNYPYTYQAVINILDGDDSIQVSCFADTIFGISTMHV